MSFKLRKISRDKKAIVAGFMGMFVATIAVVIILLVFVLISGFVKITSGTRRGVAVKEPGEDEVSIYSYMIEFAELVTQRFLDLEEISEVQGGQNG